MYQFFVTGGWGSAWGVRNTQTEWGYTGVWRPHAYRWSATPRPTHQYSGGQSPPPGYRIPRPEYPVFGQPGGPTAGGPYSPAPYSPPAAGQPVADNPTQGSAGAAGACACGATDMSYSSVVVAPGQTVQVLGASLNRRYAFVQNAGASDVYIQIGAAVPKPQGILLSGGAGYEWESDTPPPANHVFVYNPGTSSVTVTVVDG